MPDQSLPMPGGALPSRDVVVPYQGGEVHISPEAQVAQRAATEYFNSFGFQPGRKHNRLDTETQANLNELMLAMRRDRPKPATVINLHPFELQFNADNYLLRGHSIPACLPGMPYNYKAIRGWRHDGGSYNENGSRKFKAILPIDVAGQFAREFNKIETFGPGVLIYLGDSHPDKVGLVETYDPLGRLITVDKAGQDYDEEDRPIPVTLKEPVTRKFTDLLRELRKARNDFYLTRVQQADQWATKDNGKFSSWIQSSHRLMAEVLYHDGIIQSVPDWKLSTRMEKGLAEDNCRGCGRPVIKKAHTCEHCGNVIDALAAFEDGAIQFDHAKISLLPDEEYAKAEAIHKERAKRLAKRQKKQDKD